MNEIRELAGLRRYSAHQDSVRDSIQLGNNDLEKRNVIFSNSEIRNIWFCPQRVRNLIYSYDEFLIAHFPY